MKIVLRDLEVAAGWTLQNWQAPVTRALKDFTHSVNQRSIAPARKFTVFFYDYFERVRPTPAHVDSPHPRQFFERRLSPLQINREERSIQLIAHNGLDLLFGHVTHIAHDIDRTNRKDVHMRNTPEQRSEQHRNSEKKHRIRYPRQGFCAIPHARPPVFALPGSQRKFRQRPRPWAPGNARSCRERY